MPRRTKIVGTLGPAVDPPEVLAAVIAAGLDVARVNFSHGSEADHLGRVARLREAAQKAGRIVAVLADLPGPKLRVRIPGPRPLRVGDVIHFSLAADPPAPDVIGITEPEVLADVRPGHRLLLDDGRLQLEAGEVANGVLSATVMVGGTLLENKGLNLPDTPLGIPSVTARDRDALAVAAKAGVDWVALSFVRGPEAAAEVRQAAADFGLRVPVMAKIERPEAVRRSAAIIQAFDGIMVARGDLGVETAFEELPTVQKQLIAAARLAGKPVVTATEMLDSMRQNPRPTRAEASDVANAIYDGTDAVMLSGETAVGQYPVEAVRCMARIAEETEKHLQATDPGTRGPAVCHTNGDVDEPLAVAACDLARQVGATAIVTPTLSGRTARMIAKHRPWARVVAPAPTAAVVRRMALAWGVRPVVMAPLSPGESRMVAAVRDAFHAGAVAAGERAVVMAGHPLEGGPRLPTLRVVRVGEGGTSLEP
ncbi:MAG: pyruvate kinase [Gemmataceae bacterium]